MPKEKRRTSIVKHAPSARPSNRFNVLKTTTPDKADKVEPGSMAGVSATEILASLGQATSQQQPDTQPSKKEKLRQKHEAFVKRVKIAQSGSPPAQGADGESSKPKRGKRRSVKQMKNSLTGSMGDMSAALDELMVPSEGVDGASESAKTTSEGAVKSQNIMIGQNITKLNAAQRKRILQVNFLVSNPLYMLIIPSDWRSNADCPSSNNTPSFPHTPSRPSGYTPKTPSSSTSDPAKSSAPSSTRLLN
ncbi:hypothetical protein FRB99_007416 [Tulasnella sp. 403]|nr:hypothetical protein FRB99_007416 [Tulasnella sp. 403]